MGNGSEPAVLAVLESECGQKDHALAASASAVPPVESFLRQDLDETVATVTHVHKTTGMCLSIYSLMAASGSNIISLHSFQAGFVWLSVGEMTSQEQADVAIWVFMHPVKPNPRIKLLVVQDLAKKG